MISELANHLWQSTIFAAAVGVLIVLVRRNDARVRYWLWLAASLKFLIPFGFLMALGGQAAWAPEAQQRLAPAVAATVAQINAPFSDEVLTIANSEPFARGVPAWHSLVLIVWGLGFATIAFIRLRLWQRVRRVVDGSTATEVPGIDVPAAVQVRSAPGVLEPAVVGMFRPILLLPTGIQDYLSPRQLRAVIAHELCHMRRNDNFTAAIHMAVEAVFWFHPLVWWIGARLVEARERACDEHVVRELGDPEAYAEGILNVCRRYVQAPIVCVSGVSGADLRSRVEAIMANRAGVSLTAVQKCALSVSAVLAFLLPVTVGAITRPEVAAPTGIAVAGQTPAVQPAPAFEVASVKPNRTETPPSMMVPPRGSVVITNVPLRNVIINAFRVPAYRLVGGPDWIRSERFDITAKPPDDAAPGQTPLMLQALLAERFALRVHREVREQPIYELVLASADGRLGPGLKRSTADCASADQNSDPLTVSPDSPCGGMAGFGRNGGGTVVSNGRPLSRLVSALSTPVNRTIVDRTGLEGSFDIRLQWAPDVNPGASTDDAPSLFTALQEQLGLKLESSRGPVEVLVIDSVERPTAD